MNRLQYKHTMTGHQDEKLSPQTAILGMVNGMIGGLILLLPVFALKAGWLVCLVVIFVTCAFSYYSCYLCLIHLGDQSDLDYAIFRHFNGNRAIKIFYDLCVWSNLMFLAVEYFELIVVQWTGLIPPHQFTWLNPFINTFVLIAFVFVLKYFEFGASLMAYGIISIVTYVAFLVWASVTYDQGYHESEYVAVGSGAVDLAAAMGQAFSIQSFFIPVVRKAPNPHRYTVYTLIAYIAGCLSYYYIAYAGSFSIWQRHFFGEGSDHQDTVEDYFNPGKWEVNIIEGIYLIHLYSVFPEFLLISKKRVFSIFGLEESERGKVNLPEVFYIVLMVGFCFLIGIFKVSISDIIDINGAVIGFFFIYLLPVVLHIKCLYFSKGKRPVPQLPEADYSRLTEERPSALVLETGKNSPSIGLVAPQGQRLSAEAIERLGTGQVQGSEQIVVAAEEIEYSCYCCNVDRATYSSVALAFDWFMMVVMVGLGVFIMVNGVVTVADPGTSLG